MTLTKEKLYNLKLFWVGFAPTFLSMTVGIIWMLKYPDIFSWPKTSVIRITLLVRYVIPLVGTPIMLYFFANGKKMKWLITLLWINIWIFLLGLLIQGNLIISIALYSNVLLRLRREKKSW